MPDLIFHANIEIWEQADPDGGEFYKASGLCASKMSSHVKQKAEWNFLKERKLKQHENKIKCKILDWIIKEKL